MTDSLNVANAIIFRSPYLIFIRTYNAHAQAGGSCGMVAIMYSIHQSLFPPKSYKRVSNVGRVEILVGFTRMSYPTLPSEWKLRSWGS